MSPRPRKERTQHIPPVPTELEQLLASSDRSAWQLTEGFRDSLCSYVGVLKSNGIPPERMLTVVKRLLSDARPQIDHSLIEQAVKWCIEAYYRPD